MPESSCSSSALAARLAGHGLILRGGFHPEPGEAGLAKAGTILLVGNAGPAMWRAFALYAGTGPDPLDRWTRMVIEPLAAAFEATALYPFGEPHWPFQRWALRSEALHPSPLGLLIHPIYGLWHAYRAALLFRERLALPAPSAAPSPCTACVEKPCLSACPAGAFSAAGLDLPACAAHLAAAGSACTQFGCHARNACPGGRGAVYDGDQIRFHMRAYRRTVAPSTPAGAPAMAPC